MLDWKQGNDQRAGGRDWSGGSGPEKEGVEGAQFGSHANSNFNKVLSYDDTVELQNIFEGGDPKDGNHDSFAASKDYLLPGEQPPSGLNRIDGLKIHPQTAQKYDKMPQNG